MDNVDLDALQEQEDDNNKANPQIDSEATAITTDFRGQPIFNNESYFTLEDENYKEYEAIQFLGHYIRECGAEQILEALGAKEHNTIFNPEGEE